MRGRSFTARNREDASGRAPAGYLELARVVGVDPDGRALLQLEKRPGPIAARVASVTEAQLREAMQRGERVVVSFEAGDVSRPMVLGVLATPVAAAAALVESRSTDGADPREEEVSGNGQGTGERTAADKVQHQVVEVDVDGRRVRVVGKDEIVLECGKASITLRRNGKVVIRGTQVETNSEGTNRIKGGQVRIN